MVRPHSLPFTVSGSCVRAPRAPRVISTTVRQGVSMSVLLAGGTLVGTLAGCMLRMYVG